MGWGCTKVGGGRSSSHDRSLGWGGGCREVGGGVISESHDRSLGWGGRGREVGGG